MNIEEYRSYCLSKKGVTESFPFSKLPNTFVFKVLGKMFTATDIDSFKSISVKADPDKIESLRARYSCLDTQAYMHKKHWNKVLLDNSVDDSIIYKWIDTSYELVIKNLTKKQQQELKSL
jgi:predicted DNA-binding protein (MmcQ/YjbR family)